MAESALIYLAPGAFSRYRDAGLEEATVLYQAGAGETPERLTLAQALNERAGAAVDLVLTSAEALLTGVTLSRKQARHLQRVLPYLLEEQLLEPPEALWFATGKAEHGRYPVAVINREALEALLAACREAGVRAARLRVDADLLAPETPVLITVDHWGSLILERDQALVADADQREALIALHHDEERPFTRLEDDLTLCDRLRAGLAADRGVEVLQGPYAARQSQRSGPSPWAPWKPVAGLAAAVFLIALAAVWAQQWRYQQAADQAFADAAELYQSLFPGDRATSGLRRQFEARLARLGSGGEGGGGTLFAVLPAVASTLGASEVEPKRIQFDQRDGSLLLDLGAKEYNQVEKLQTALREKGVQATIANYRNGASGVTARVKVEQAG
ncbi:type II secretion system protein GspL [Alloalcanivorax profundimaris]|uniref:type II secretion system protein GspL n=1 Tax=Alloalcanivorax profundimaris TaxID=2735259 RepID=UPI001887E162|nr:type II secretion system protein GspL [Alloalcanivorax profundimaris]MBF1801402.1 general secretion pathway protein GspL [Alloalcanivorax profundimaris]MCQ6261710.1 type II secretion system protein GspL [Alcanivorax sp. MM125-6]